MSSRNGGEGGEGGETVNLRVHEIARIALGRGTASRRALVVEREAIRRGNAAASPTRCYSTACERLRQLERIQPGARLWAFQGSLDCSEFAVLEVWLATGQDAIRLAGIWLDEVATFGYELLVAECSEPLADGRAWRCRLCAQRAVSDRAWVRYPGAEVLP